MDLQATVTTATDSEYARQIASGTPVSEATAAALEAGGAVAASAACAATGIGVAVLPLCAIGGGLIGKVIAKPVSNLISDAGHFFSHLFGGSSHPGSLIKPSDAPNDPNGVGWLYTQIQQTDYLNAVAFQVTIDQCVGTIRNAGKSVNADDIVSSMKANGLPLIPNGGLPGAYLQYMSPVLDVAANPEVALHTAYIPEQFAPAGLKVLQAWNVAGQPGVGLGAVYASHMQAILTTQRVWGTILQVEAGRQLALAGAKVIVATAQGNEAALTRGGNDQAVELVKVWYLLNGVTDGVQFLRPEQRSS